MPELAQPDNYVGAEPRLQIVNVPSGSDGSSPYEVPVFTTTPPYIWRVRSLAVHGIITGAVGTARIGLSFDISGLAGQPWTNANNDSGIQAMSPQDINAGDSFAYTWSTEIGDNYLSTNVQWGKTAVLGLPMVWLPPQTDIVIEATGAGGFNGSLQTNDGYMMIEYLRQEGAGIQTAALDQVYLLPLNQ